MLDQQKGKIWMDGTMVNWPDAKVHILTHTLHYGSGVFEGERAYSGKIFKMQEHHERLHRSAGMLGIEIPFTVEQINKAAMAVIEENKLTAAYIRPVVWHGPEALSVCSTHNSVHLSIAAWEWGAYFDAADGIRLAWSKWVRPAPNVGPVRAKANGQYITGMMSKNQAEKEGFDDALMLDYRGYVAECTGANIFYVKEGKLFTPIPDCFLDGITRQSVMEIAHELGLSVTEKHFKPEELMEADEVFITGTAVEVQPIRQIGDQTFTVGPVTKKLAAAYKKCVNGESYTG